MESNKIPKNSEIQLNDLYESPEKRQLRRLVGLLIGGGIILLAIFVILTGVLLAATGVETTGTVVSMTERRASRSFRTHMNVTVAVHQHGGVRLSSVDLLFMRSARNARATFRPGGEVQLLYLPNFHIVVENSRRTVLDAALLVILLSTFGSVIIWASWHDTEKQEEKWNI
ncbi:MAG: hypothetical protein FWG68_00300 [Defluviitaleaceae bacterium]|nr:hypothetical protein [Defluviitaleaceae bacterium]